jgi:aspartyl-tRNA synthetase
MLKYGSDKPDLRIPIQISDVTDIFKSSEVKLEIFKKKIKKNSIVRAIPVKNVKDKSRSFFDNLNEWAKSEGAGGLAYISLVKSKESFKAFGPIGKYFSEKALNELMKKCNITDGDSLFFICDKQKIAEKISGLSREKIARELKLIDENVFEFCWITDFPLYRYDEDLKKIDFSHNPFSMPNIKYEDFDKVDPLNILAKQYDLVCNGVEISSGAIRNHIPKLMYKVFSKVGYSKENVDKKFSGMIKALSYGAPPHGGMAPGIDRIVMLLANEENIREITLFPLTQNAQDLLMGAPLDVSDEQLKDLNLKILKK